ncbi:MAG: DUF3667 domain-containing protein [Gammaproteobacteria bacterium]
MNEPDQAPPSRNCPNCGAPFVGPFCANCGQEDHSLAVPLHRLIQDFLSDQFQFDGRIWHTLQLILFHPGRLTRNYLSGQRQRYIPPIRLYLFISIVFFLTIGLSPIHLINFNIKTPNTPHVMTPGTATRLPGVEAPTKQISAHKHPPGTVSNAGGLIKNRIAGSTSQKAPAAASAMRPLARWVKSHAVAADATPGEFSQHFWSNMPKVLFFLIPIFALLLKLFYLPRKRYYSEHLIFALHYHSVIFLNLLVITLLLLGASVSPTLVATTLQWLSAILGAWTVLYVFPALRTAYADTWPRTILRGLSVLFLYFIAIGVGTLGALMVTLAMT